MIKKLVSTLCIIFSVSVFCQETLVTFQNDLKTSSSDIKDVIPVVNTENDEIKTLKFTDLLPLAFGFDKE
jgi:hypothetical protein